MPKIEIRKKGKKGSKWSIEGGGVKPSAHYGLLHLFLSFAAPSNLVDMDELLPFELAAFLLRLCEAVNFLQKPNKSNHSENISKIVEEKSCSHHELDRQTNDEPKTAKKNRIVSMLLIEILFCRPLSGIMIKHIVKLLNILPILFMYGIEKPQEFLIGMTENL